MNTISRTFRLSILNPSKNISSKHIILTSWFAIREIFFAILLSLYRSFLRQDFLRRRPLSLLLLFPSKVTVLTNILMLLLVLKELELLVVIMRYRRIRLHILVYIFKVLRNHLTPRHWLLFMVIKIIWMLVMLTLTITMVLILWQRVLSCWVF